MSFKIYKENIVVSAGSGPLTIKDIRPGTVVESGEYQVVRVSKTNEESERIDIPSFKVGEELEITTSPKTSKGVSGQPGSRVIKVNQDMEVAFSTDEVIGLTVSELGLLEWTEEVPKGTYETTVKVVNGFGESKHILTLE